MKLGKLTFVPVENNLNLLAAPVKKSIEVNKYSDVLVAEIDPQIADTTSFCEQYVIGTDVSVNCVIVEAKRADRVWYAACLIVATTRADINGIVRRQLDAKKLSFAPMEAAVSLTGMEYGGITPIGLPAEWTVLVDSAVIKLERVVIGSGIRKSKLLVKGSLLGSLPNALKMDITI